MKISVLVVACVLVNCNAFAAETSLINRNSQGNHTGESFDPTISSDGNTVIFTSSASDLVSPGLDTNGFEDVFAYDTELRSISLVSVNSSGEQANANSAYASVSGDGRFVTFTSAATNLSPSASNGVRQVYLHDRVTETTTLVSRNMNGGAANDYSISSSVSDDGRYVAFRSGATDLVPGDTNNADDIFLFDRVSVTTSRVSVSTAGEQANSISLTPVISGDGNVIAFTSLATNLTAVDENDDVDVFKHTIATGVTIPVSANVLYFPLPFGGILKTYFVGDQGSYSPSISQDGSSIAFVTRAPSLHGFRSGTVVMLAQSNDALDVVGDLNRLRNEGSHAPSISSDGRYVYFESYADAILPNNTSGGWKNFVMDTENDILEQVNVTSSGNTGSRVPPNFAFDSGAQRRISADGTRVAFQQTTNLLVPDDTDSSVDVFLRERGDECTPTTPGATKNLPSNQWLLLSLPCSLLPDANTVEDVFADDITGALGDTWALVTYDASSANPGYEAATLSTPLKSGQGFWIIQDTGASVVLDLPDGSREVTGRRTQPETACLSVAGCFELALTGAPNQDFLWNMIGNPFPGTNSVAFNDLRVSTTVGACAGPSGCTMTEAASDNALIVADIFFHYNGSGYVSRLPGSTLSPWEGYWVPELRLSDFNSPLIRFPR